MVSPPEADERVAVARPEAVTWGQTLEQILEPYPSFVTQAQTQISKIKYMKLIVLDRKRYLKLNAHNDLSKLHKHKQQVHLYNDDQDCAQLSAPTLLSVARSSVAPSRSLQLSRLWPHSALQLNLKLLGTAVPLQSLDL